MSKALFHCHHSSSYNFQTGREKFDRTHKFAAYFLYEIPISKFFSNTSFLKQVFGGYRVLGIIQRQSDQPFTILSGIDSNGDGNGGDRPNYNPGGIFTYDPMTGNLRLFTTSRITG